jgi:hypothetical protein
MQLPCAYHHGHRSPALDFAEFETVLLNVAAPTQAYKTRIDKTADVYARYLQR